VGGSGVGVVAGGGSEVGGVEGGSGSAEVTGSGVEGCGDEGGGSEVGGGASLVGCWVGVGSSSSLPSSVDWLWRG
jgi:hypothetical protein